MSRLDKTKTIRGCKCCSRNIHKNITETEVRKLASEIKRIRERRKKASGEYDIIHRETSGELTKLKDGSTAQGHVDSNIGSDDGAHGLRYDTDDKKLLTYNRDSNEWEEIETGGGFELLKGTEDPTESTHGAGGQMYLNTETGVLFVCVAIDGDVHEWLSVGSSGSSGSNAAWLGAGFLGSTFLS